MIRNLTLAALLLGASLSTVHAQSQSDSSVPTIPETQIEPRKVATPYEFISAASSADDFSIKSSQMALQRAQSDDVKALASTLIADHGKAMTELMAAGKADTVDIAEPSPDGEQQGLLGKLEAVEGADFDRLYVEAQIFVHQRALALFKGYAGGDSNLAGHAAKTLPVLSANYAKAVSLAGAMGLGDAAQ